LRKICVVGKVRDWVNRRETVLQRCGVEKKTAQQAL